MKLLNENLFKAMKRRLRNVGFRKRGVAACFSQVSGCRDDKVRAVTRFTG